MLTGAQIRKLGKEALTKSNVKTPSFKFVTALSQFIEDIAQQVTHLQSKFTDPSFLKNFTNVTQKEFDEFIKLVWEQYERAVMVPGEACGAVTA